MIWSQYHCRAVFPALFKAACFRGCSKTLFSSVGGSSFWDSGKCNHGHKLHSETLQICLFWAYSTKPESKYYHTNQTYKTEKYLTDSFILTHLHLTRLQVNSHKVDYLGSLAFMLIQYQRNIFRRNMYSTRIHRCCNQTDQNRNVVSGCSARCICRRLQHPVTI